MTDINALFPSKYLKSSDIKGHEPTVAISHIALEKVGEKDGKDEHKPVLYFQNKEKGMVLNRTNADAISELYGPDTDDWAGREVTIFVMRVSGPQGMTDGLRLKAPNRKPKDPGFQTSSGTAGGKVKVATVQPPADLPDDEVPF